MTRAVPLWPVALLVGAGFVVSAQSGRSDLFVRPWFAPVLIATAVAVSLVAVRLRRTRLPAHVAFVLLLPVAVGATITPALVSRASQGTADPSRLAARLFDPTNPLLAGGGGDVTLLQILLAEQQLGGVALAGRSVTVEAIVAGPHRLVRSAMVCCAADAQTVAVIETGPTLPRSGRWVRVAGRLAVEGDRTVLAATSVAPIPTPADPFL